MAPLLTGLAQVEPIWRRLAERAGVSGWSAGMGERAAQTTDPALRLELHDGAELAPFERRDGRWTFRIPCGARAVRLLSHHVRPSDDIGPFLDDRRHLGVAVSSLVLWNGLDDQAIPASALVLAGWHAQEGELRWTNGAAELDLPAAGDATLLDIHVGATMRYRLPPLRTHRAA